MKYVIGTWRSAAVGAKTSVQIANVKGKIEETTKS
jgi:hypothetical protein